MNIGLVSDTYEPQINGVVTSIELFKRALEEKGHTVYVFCPYYNGRGKKHYNIYRYFSVPWPFKAMKEQRFVIPLPVRKTPFRDLDINILHSQVPGNMGWFAVVKAMIYRIPHVHTYHTLYIEYTHYMPVPLPLAQIIVRIISRRFCATCQRVITPSAEIKQEVAGYGVKRPLDVIPTGIDFEADRKFDDPERIKAAYGIPPGKKIISFIGRFGKEKSIGFLLDMLVKLIPLEPEIHFLLVGDGPDRADLEHKTSALDLDKYVTFTGYVPRDYIFNFFKLTDVFVFSSKTETQGIVLLEAMSVGTPVVAVGAMGVNDLMQDGKGGFLIDDLDEDEFIEKILQLLDDPELYARKSREALEKAEAWSVNKMADKLIECYKKAITDYRR
jgi:1,2-diacylglycerol 3-alpha-glucosyltransferase